MDNFLERKNLNYDIGLCQINSWWLSRLNLKNEDLLDYRLNIFVAAKIYNDNVKLCNGDIYCALSMYNTGKKNSSIGIKYAKKVLAIRQKIYNN